MGDGLRRLLAVVRRRLRLNRFFAGLALGLLLGGGVVLCYGLVSRLTVLPDVDLLVATLGIAGVVVTALTLTAGPIDQVDAALVADRWLGSGDAFASALTLPTGPEADPMGLASLHAARAESLAAGMAALPTGPDVPIRRMAVGASVLALAAALLIAPNPRDADRARLAEERTAAEEAAALLEEAAEQLADDPASTAPVLAEQLRELAEQLRDTPLAEALDDLDRAAADLARQEARDLPQRIALDGLTQELAGNPLAGSSAADPAAQLEALAAEVGAGEISDAETLAERLGELGDSLTEGIPAAAAGLQAAAATIGQPGGQAVAADGLRRAAQAVRDAQTAAANAAAAGAAADAAGDAASQARGQGQGEGQGQGPGQGEGQGQGQGEGQGQGAGGSGGGSGEQGATVNAPGTGAGGQGQSGTGGQAQGQAPRPGQETATGHPVRPDVDPAEQVFLGGTPDGLEQAPVVGTQEGQGLSTDARVPYLDVLAEYARRATSVVDQPGYPLRLRDTVRDYFDRLARGATQ